MFHLQGSQVLQMLEKSLRSSLPESLKVRVEHSQGKKGSAAAYGKGGKENKHSSTCSVPGTHSSCISFHSLNLTAGKAHYIHVTKEETEAQLHDFSKIMPVASGNVMTRIHHDLCCVMTKTEKFWPFQKWC